MKYIFEKSSYSELVGNFYKLAPDGVKELVAEGVSVDKNLDLRYKIALTCQQLAGGLSLESIFLMDWSLDRVEFFYHLDNEKEYMSWFQKAGAIRERVVLERLFKQLEEADITEGNIEKMERLLKSLKEAIRKREEETGLKSIMNVKAYKIPILDKKGWGLERVDANSLSSAKGAL